ncbi:uncharacterized protein LOC124413583 isoform X2 [Diprion similis]|uniref:uncharacterized protein LOC124413583 isoform X2 n=1 Tax=Diprion similis TaxID=362088 RepID=UPI001EF8DDBA|nr:uncharacterized protein LOC124413583 isoform X2 [Diprion similis]
MLRPLIVLFIVTTNLCNFLDTYKITADETSRTVIEAYERQGSELQDEYLQDENYSSEDSGRVVIGKWRNNGEALEPKWRDGDSVPLAPFSTISFTSGWREEPDSVIKYDENEPVGLSFDSRVGIKDLDNTGAGTSREEKIYIGIRGAERKPKSREHRNYHRTTEVYSSVSRNGGEKLSETFRSREDTRKNPDTIDDVDHAGTAKKAGKYRETLQNYTNQYELFNDGDNDDPRPRKRRPPGSHEFPGSWKTMEIREEASELAETGGENGKESSRESVDLKAFLKMQGNNLSLSEILQQKNLTLTDILKGKPDAIRILKSNKREDGAGNEEDENSGEESSSTELPDRSLLVLRNSSNYENGGRWSPSRKIIPTTKSDGNSSFEDLNVGLTRVNLETRVPLVLNISESYSDLLAPEAAKNASNVSSTNEIRLPNLRLEENEAGNLKAQLINSDNKSLSSETTTVFKDGIEADRKIVVNSDDKRFLPETDDEDEIMEFSDYPSKMPKFIPPVYDITMRNSKRKHILHGAIQMNIPQTDVVAKLDAERVVPLKTNVRPIISDTETKIVNKTETEASGIAKKPQNEVLKHLRNQTGQIELAEKIVNTNSNSSEGRPLLNLSNLRNDEKNFTFNQKLHEVVIPKVDPQSRAEILELFSSGSSAERLERLLASRNMSIEELIALRQRGSSQVHFAEVFRAKEQSSMLSSQNLKANHQYREEVEKIQPTNDQKRKDKVNKSADEVAEASKESNVPSDSQSIDMKLESTEKLKMPQDKSEDQDKAKENFGIEGEYFATDLINLFSQSKNVTKNISDFDKDISDSDKTVKNPIVRWEEVGIRMGPRTHAVFKEVTKNLDLIPTVQSMTANKNVQRDSEGSSYYTSIEAVKVPVLDGGIQETESVFEGVKKPSMNLADLEEIGRVEEILKNDIDLMKNLYGINDYEYPEKKSISKVKPSIIASGGILGVTIVIFLSIFIACRIQQKKKFTYRNSFSKAVFHNPGATARKLSNTSSINSIMVDVVATSTVKRPQKQCNDFENDDFESKTDIDNDSLDANDSWETIPDFMK